MRPASLCNAGAFSLKDKEETPGFEGGARADSLHVLKSPRAF